MEKSRYREEESSADAELMDRVRVGDAEAFGPLYRRHAHAALGYARHWSHDAATAEDLRAEAFSRTLCALLNGSGPRGPLGPYLYTVIRNVSADWKKRDRATQLVGDLADLPVPDRAGESFLDALEYSLAVKAFNALPERWRTVLQHTLVDDQGCHRVAAQLGIGAPAAASLAYRAREGLRQAYLQVHIGQVTSESCRPYAKLLGAYTRDGLGSRQSAQVRGHLRGCRACSALARMLRGINAALRTGTAAREGTGGGRGPARPGAASPTRRHKSLMLVLGTVLSGRSGGDRSRGAWPRNGGLPNAARVPAYGRSFVSRAAPSRAKSRARPRSSGRGFAGGRSPDSRAGSRRAATRPRRRTVTATGPCCPPTRI